jgi:hypothetical protein
MLAATYDGHVHLSMVEHRDDCPTHGDEALGEGP